MRESLLLVMAWTAMIGSPPPEAADTGRAEGASSHTETLDRARPTATIRIKNGTGSHRYTPAGRSMFDGLSLERQVEGRWVSVPYRPAVCVERCPSDDSTPSFCDCRPPVPWAGRIPPDTQIEYSWGGVVFRYRRVKGCTCHDEEPAPKGHYRATACVFSGVVCVGPGTCDETGPEPGWVKNGRATSGEETCVSTTFDYSDADQTVELTISE